MKAGFVALVLGAASGPVLADGWTADFTITNLYIAGENNFQYRLYGMPSVAACTSAPNWAYINDADPGSKGMVATLLGAYYSGRVVRVNLVTTNGFCHIIELFVS
jgi:hypothetical protein